MHSPIQRAAALVFLVFLEIASSNISQNGQILADSVRTTRQTSHSGLAAWKISPQIIQLGLVKDTLILRGGEAPAGQLESDGQKFQQEEDFETSDWNETCKDLVFALESILFEDSPSNYSQPGSDVFPSHLLPKVYDKELCQVLAKAFELENNGRKQVHLFFQETVDYWPIIKRS
jgi:hypothetical protein